MMRLSTDEVRAIAIRDKPRNEEEVLRQIESPKIGYFYFSSRERCYYWYQSDGSGWKPQTVARALDEYESSSIPDLWWCEPIPDTD